MEAIKLDFPEKFNAAERFVDWNVQQGRGNKVAIYHKDEEITYQEVLDNVNRTGNALKSLGVQMENRVLIIALDCPQFVYTYFGAMKIGAVPVPTNTMLRSADYKYILNDSRAKILVISDSLLPVVMEVKDELIFLEKIIVIGNAPEGTLNFDELIKDFPTECETAPTNAEDTAFWLYSSGTTGFPKGTVHLHQNMSYSSECYAKGVLEMTENDRTFSVARLFFAYGLGNGLFFPFYCGASTVLHPDRPQPDHVYSVITKYKPTVFFGVPTSFNAMLQVKDAKDKYDVSSIRIAGSAGEALPGNVWKGWKDMWGVEILDGIGSTEILHIYISNRIGQSKPDCTGILVPGYEAKVVDPDGVELPRGEAGVLMMKGDSISAYYWNKREKTKNTYVGHWFNTGDQYIIDEEGYFTYAGRGDDMIKAGGIWVSPVEVEAAVMRHEAVLECGCCGWPDDDGLFKPKAFITFKEGVKVTDELMEEIKLFVKNSIAPFKFPRWIEPIDELPKTATGKIQRYKLRQLAEKK